MNAKYNKIMILVGVISLVCFISSVSAQPQEGNKQPFKQKRQEAIENFAEELQLTPEQQELIKQQRSQQQKQTKSTREELKTKNQELRQELEKPVVDEAKVNGLVSEINALQAEQLKQHVQGVITMKEILTPQQEEKLKAKRQERQEKMQQRRGSIRERFKERFFSP